MRFSRSYLVLIVLLAVALPACATEAAKEEQGSETAGASDAGVAAYVGDEAITLKELDQMLETQLARIRQDEYDLRARGLQQLVLSKLLNEKADEQGITLQELTAQIDANAPKPSDEAVNETYNMMKDTDQTLKAKNEEQGKKLVRQQLEAQMLQQHRDEYIGNLMADSNVRVVIEPPRVAVNIPDGEPSIGPKDAPVTVVEFADYQCGYCKRALPTIKRLIDEYGDKIHFVFRDYALQFHPRAEPAAAAARCAGDQGKYWEYHDHLVSVNGPLDDAELKKRAEQLELDMAAFAGCYESDRHTEAIRTGFADGSALGVTGTPTFFINGRMLVGAQPFAALQSVIEEELQRKAVKTQ